jgi:hypothetical protein
VAEIDVIALGWGYVDGSPDLLMLTATFAAPVTGGGDALFDFGIWPRGSGSPLGTRIEVSDGAAECNFPGSDGPLPGESCEVNTDGEILVVRDVSGMTGRVDVTVSSIHFAADDSLVRDAAQIIQVVERA